MPRSFGGNRPSIAPVVVLAPVEDTTAGRWRFGNGTAMTGPGKVARPCYVQNGTGQLIYVRVNAWHSGGSGGWFDATATAYDHKIADGAQVDVSELGSIAVHTLSIWIANAGVEESLYIRGFVE